MRKSWVMMTLKFKMLMTNTSALTGPLMAIGMTFAMRLFYSSISDSPEMMASLLSMALSLGVSLNIGMGAIMMTALPLAEEKEKNTLRTLMTSSINAKQFFLGSLLPPFLITVGVNYLLIFVSGIDIQSLNIQMFSFLTILGALISSIIGLVVGICAKSQMNANNLMIPVTLVLSMFPTLASFNDTISIASKYLYTGMLSDLLSVVGSHEAYRLDVFQVIALVMCVVISSSLFIFYYRKNGMESD